MNISPALRATSDGRVDLPPSGADARGFPFPRDCNAPGGNAPARAKCVTARRDVRGAVDADGNVAPLGLRPRKRWWVLTSRNADSAGRSRRRPAVETSQRGGGESTTPADATARNGQSARERGSDPRLGMPPTGAWRPAPTLQHVCRAAYGANSQRSRNRWHAGKTANYSNTTPQPKPQTQTQP